MADPKFDRYLRADAAIHALGLVLGVVGAVAILIVAARSSQPGQVGPILVYVAGLLAMLSCSAAYNLRAGWSSVVLRTSLPLPLTTYTVPLLAVGTVSSLR